MDITCHSNPAALSALHERLVLLQSLQSGLEVATPQSENTPPGTQSMLAAVNAQMAPLLGAVVADPTLRSHGGLVAVACKVGGSACPSN